MPLLLPFFKFDVMAWLTSEKIAFMHASQVGAYIMLLAQCWTQPTCTLPNDLAQLKTWGKWQDHQHGDFAPVLACFEPLKKTGRLTNLRLYAEWQEACMRTELLRESGQRGAEKRWAKKPRPLPQAKTLPGDWLTLFQAKPIYAHVNWPREHARMDDWLSEHPGRKKNRDFIRNWVNKIEPPLSNGSASLHCTLCKKSYPDAKEKATHDYKYHSKYVG